MATITASVARPMQPVTASSANVSIVKEQTYVTTATASVSDVWLFKNLMIPDRAIITVIEWRGSVVDGTYIFELGTYGSGGAADAFGSATLSATAADLTRADGWLRAAFPYTVSCSDDATYRYQTIGVRVDGAATSGTGSVSINLIVSYYMR